MQIPNDPLRQKKHGDVGNDLDARRCEHDFRKGVAFAWKVEFPDSLVRPALHIQEEDAKYSPKALEEYDGHATPPERAPFPINWNKDPAPVQQDCGFDQWKGCRVAAAVDQN